MITVIIISKGTQYDVSDYIKSVKWSGKKGSPCRSISCEVLDDVQAWKALGLDWEILKGLRCVFSWNDEKLFQGIITDTGQNESCSMTFKAYDYGIYFTNSSNTFVYSNKTLGEIVIDCCQRAGVAYDVIAQTDYKVQNITKPRAKYWDVIQSAMQITKRQTGKSYFIQFSDNACHLFERKDCLLQWVIATGENLLKYDYSNSIQQTKTRVKLIDSAQKVVVMKNDAELEACIGTFQDVQQPDDGNTKADLERCAERLLDAQKIPQRTLSLTALGITEAISGYCVYVIIDRLNWGKSFFIDEDTHTFKGNYHEMNLKIKLCGDEISTSVSGILSDYKVEKSTSSTSSESSQLIDLARQQIGKPYVYGASGPNSFDCSGFVCYCYKHTSKPGIGRPNAQGLYGMCKIVSSPQSGDLVFFSDSGSVQRITHVGLYIGNSQMIAAEGTQVQLVSNPSARSSFVGYGRFK